LRKYIKSACAIEQIEWICIRCLYPTNEQRNEYADALSYS
jgi:hypothetical protein